MSQKKSKFGLGIALLVVGLILISTRFNKEVEVNLPTTFAQEPVEISGFLNQENGSEKLPQRIIIPALSIDLEVKEAEIINGYWEVFPDTAAWGSGSGLPGKPGNQVIFAHAREGLFLPLKNIKTQMRVYVLTDDSWLEYQVMEIKEVQPNQIETIAPTDDETLTLYTCTGFQDSNRLIVVAKRS